jgi:hypothetical protein
MTEYPAFVVSLAVPLRVVCGAGFVGLGLGLVGLAIVTRCALVGWLTIAIV